MWYKITIYYTFIFFYRQKNIVEMVLPKSLNPKIVNEVSGNKNYIVGNEYSFKFNNI